MVKASMIILLIMVDIANGIEINEGPSTEKIVSLLIISLLLCIAIKHINKIVFLARIVTVIIIMLAMSYILGTQ